MRLSKEYFTINIYFANNFLYGNKKDCIIKSMRRAISAEFIIHERQLNYAEQRV